ncbi:MAG TPA: EamA family transporter [Actinomycetes bacterium]
MRRADGWRLPSPVLVLGAIASVQLGAALAKLGFDRTGPVSMVTLRLAVGALVLLAVARPRLRGRGPGQLLPVLAFGVVLAGMNTSFYGAIDRIPIGIAVTIEFSGPLAVAVAGSRRLLDGVWVVLAAAGVVLLTRGGGSLDPLGLGLAGVAGLGWACYILLSQRVGRGYPGVEGLALATAVAAVLVAPAGVAQAGGALADWRVLLVGVGVGLLSAAIPYSLEIEALRRLPARVFGVLMSLEPAVGALAGLVVLGEALRSHEVVAIALVCVASAGAAWAGRATPRD